jgi:hypothetical protein
MQKDSTKKRPQSSTSFAKTRKGHKSKGEKKMSANLKSSTLGTSSKTKTRALALVDSKGKKKQSKSDPLTLYKRDAKQIISMLYEQDTPDFILDVLQGWLTELENTTQVFWNHRQILEVALPLMLQAADEMGIDYLDKDSNFNFNVAQTVAAELRDSRDYKLSCNEEPTELDIVRREIEADAEALARILNSSRVPDAIKTPLEEAYLIFADDFNIAPATVRAQYARAALENYMSRESNERATTGTEPRKTSDGDERSTQ